MEQHTEASGQAQEQKTVETFREVHLGVIEFHSERLNPGLIKEWYRFVEDLRDSGSIIDIWLMDIAALLRRYGYEMRIYSTARPEASTFSDPTPANSATVAVPEVKP